MTNFAAKLSLLGCLVMLLHAGCADPPPRPSGNIVKLGVIGPFSGPDAAVGASGYEGVELAVGLEPLLKNGDRIELVKIDDQSSPKLCIEAYDQLSDLDVAAVLLLSRSNSALALAPRARVHRIPIIATIASHPDLTEKNPHLIQLSFDDAFQGSVAAMYLRDDMLLRRAAIIGEPADIHARSLADEFARQFAEANGTIVEYLPLNGIGTNLTEKLSEWRQQRADVIYAPVQSHLLLDILRGLRTLHWDPVVMAGDGVLSEMLLKYPDEVALTEGIIATVTYSSRVPRTAFGQRLQASYLETHNQSGSIFTVLGGEGAALIMEALNRADNGDAARDIQKQLRSINGFEAFSGILSIGSNGKVIRPVYVSTVKQGKLEFLVRVY